MQDSYTVQVSSQICTIRKWSYNIWTSEQSRGSVIKCHSDFKFLNMLLNTTHLSSMSFKALNAIPMWKLYCNLLKFISIWTKDFLYPLPLQLFKFETQKHPSMALHIIGKLSFLLHSLHPKFLKTIKIIIGDVASNIYILERHIFFMYVL